MKVFKLYLKLLKKNMFVIIGYMVIFLVLALIFTSSNTPTASEFEETKIRVAMINEDDDTELISNLKEYLSKYVVYINVDKDNITDALYFRDIYHAFTIPKNFTTDFLNGEDVYILHENTPESIANFSVEQGINAYLHLVRVYQDKLPDKPISDIYTYVNNDLSKNADTNKLATKDNELDYVVFLYNYSSYIILAVILTVVGIIMLKMRSFELKKRMIVSPYPQTRTNLELLLGNAIFTIIFIILIYGLSFILYPNAMKTTNGLLLMLNAFCFTITALSLGYAIVLLVKNNEVISGITNIVSLGSAFICGAFVPQYLLGKGILTFAHIFPNYYYIYNNNRIINIQDFKWDNLKNIFLYMGIQLLFAIVFFALAIFITHKQTTEEQ